MQRTRTVSAALVAVVLGLAACGEGSSSAVADERGSAPAQTEERAPTTEPDSPDSIPADQAGGDEEQVRAVLDQQHQAFLSGDTTAYCDTLDDELKSALADCESIKAGLELQQTNGTVKEDQEILELTIEGNKAYAAVYKQEDDDSPGAKTPIDHELTKIDDVWRVSMMRYRTEREEGPAKCFVGGSTNDLC